MHGFYHFTHVCILIIPVTCNGFKIRGNVRFFFSERLRMFAFEMTFGNEMPETDI